MLRAFLHMNRLRQHRCQHSRRYRADLLALCVLLLLPLVWFAPVLLTPLTGRTLLPFDNLYAFEPWRSLQPGLIPHSKP